MEHLVAFLGSRTGGLYKVLATDEQIFELPDLTNHVDYSPVTNLDDSEWFCIEELSATTYTNDFISKLSPINTTTLNQLPVDKYSKIKYLCVESGNYKLFQKMLSSQLISKKWFSVSEAPNLNTNQKIISFHSSPDAVYDMNGDKLYFRDISKAKAIFKGIEELYREATQEEVSAFLGLDFIQLSEEYSADSVKVPNRKRIAIAMDRIASYTDEQKNEIYNYIQDYCDVEFNDNKFIIASENDLKFVLFGIDERYYTTALGNEKRLANSIVSMEQ